MKYQAEGLGPAWGAATFAAGPLVALTIVGIGLIQGYAPGMQGLLGLIGFLVPAMMIGALFASLPAALGVMLLSGLGRDHDFARSHTGWGVTGAILGGLTLGMLLPEGPACLLGAVTGALCALPARRYVRWRAEP